jgi:hypothetical protein
MNSMAWFSSSSCREAYDAGASYRCSPPWLGRTA